MTSFLWVLVEGLPLRADASSLWVCKHHVKPKVVQ
nr:MAG TPA: hypothetical protein [Caudoviricetes sp.]